MSARWSSVVMIPCTHSFAILPLLSSELHLAQGEAPQACCPYQQRSLLSCVFRPNRFRLSPSPISPSPSFQHLALVLVFSLNLRHAAFDAPPPAFPSVSPLSPLSPLNPRDSRPLLPHHPPGRMALSSHGFYCFEVINARLNGGEALVPEFDDAEELYVSSLSL